MKTRLLPTAPLLFATMAIASCAAPAKPATTAAAPPVSAPAPSAEARVDAEAFRASPPAPTAEHPFEIPQVEEATLANGMRVLLVPMRATSLVAAEIVSDHGAADAAPGVATLAAAMLEGGTAAHSAAALATAWASLGGSHAAAASRESFSLSFEVLADQLPGALALAAEVLRSSTVPATELEKARERHLTSLAQRAENPTELLEEAFGQTLFGSGNPLGVPLDGTEASVRALRASDIKAFYRDHVQPNRMAVAIAGPISLDDAKALAEKAFGSWRGSIGAPATPSVPTVPQGTPARIVVVNRPGLTQSTVSLADLGPTRHAEDFLAAQAMSTVLGGDFSSRINMNLREKHEYTYGVYAGLAALRGWGYLQSSGAIVANKTAPAIDEMRKEIALLRDTEVSDEELARVKTSLERRIRNRFEGVEATADTLAGLFAYGLPKDEYRTWHDRIAKLTKGDVQRAARTYLRPEQMRFVVVGDAAVIAKDLNSLGIGAVEIREASKAGVRSE
jgi:zinc protease